MQALRGKIRVMIDTEVYCRNGKGTGWQYGDAGFAQSTLPFICLSRLVPIA